MFDEPIKSIEQAKEYFKYMGCSGFYMCREYPQRYMEYLQLNILKEIEAEWRMEKLDEYYKDIMENRENLTLWIVHSRMEELVATLKTDKALKKMLEATRNIYSKVPFADRVLVSETINGRRHIKYRDGLIYLAYDLKNISVAKEFAELAIHFSIYEEKKSRDYERCKNSNKLCLDIMRELKL